MEDVSPRKRPSLAGVVLATDESPLFRAGDRVRVDTRSPIGHYRVPLYLRGKSGIIEGVIHPAAVDNEAEAFGRNAGSARHYYRVAFAMTELWPDYTGPDRDRLLIEVFETWLQRI